MTEKYIVIDLYDGDMSEIGESSRTEAEKDAVRFAEDKYSYSEDNDIVVAKIVSRVQKEITYKMKDECC